MKMISIFLSVLVSLVCLVVKVDCEITGQAVCDDWMNFYADGVLIAKVDGTNWWKAAPTLSFPDDTRVIAAHCQNSEGPGGFSAYFDNSVQTNTGWKCTTRYFKDWNQPWFNDIRWPQAVRVNNSWSRPANIAGQAPWIWTSGWNNTEDRHVYCRKVLPRPVNMVTGLAACDDWMNFYADGVLIATDHDISWWEAATVVSFPEDTRVIAAHCQNFNTFGGFSATFNNSVQTNTDWKCTTRYYENWNQPWFNDIGWPQAVRVTYIFREPANIKGQAPWIWTSGWNNTEDRHVYCRKVLPRPVNMVTGLAVCDDWMNFFADGVLIATNFRNFWKAAPIVSFPENTRVLAAHCQNFLGPGGFTASFNNSVQTSTDWKCTTQYFENWNKPMFNDADWPQAVNITSRNWTYPANIAGQAPWIWTSGWNNMEDRQVYCRKVLIQDC